MLPGVFDQTIFSGGPRLATTTPKFIRAMHPKNEISPTRAAIVKILAAGWWGQLKVDGHRAQIHVPAALGGDIVVFNRMGSPHRKALPSALVDEIGRLYAPKSGWSVIDAEWRKGDDQLYVFDVLKREGTILDSMSYRERYALLPRVYASPKITTLPPLRTVEQCLEILADPSEHIEGLVFKAPETRGFVDSMIVRCRKQRP